jgi:hypothetical protein
MIVLFGAASSVFNAGTNLDFNAFIQKQLLINLSEYEKNTISFLGYHPYGMQYRAVNQP